MVNYPCRKYDGDCPKRTPGCHGKCEEFAEAKAINQAEQDALKQERIADAVIAKGQSRRAAHMQYHCRKSIKLKGLM